MSQQDDSAAATKKDIRGLMEMIGKVMDEAHANKVELKAEIEKSEERTGDKLALAVEIIKAEAVGANNDRLEQHSEAISKLDIRVTRLEHQAA
ncbi:MAG: hypothetical protein PHZ00_03930 [Candidatus Peribacteraceae bacterium]|nr:hypothetical protein [Candidatus Peribacteraceae bacterium]